MIKIKVLAISDVSTGYGSRQIPEIVEFLGNHFNAEKHILEPDQIEKPIRYYLYPNIIIQRVLTTSHPHSPQGRIEYIINASKLINKIKPDVLIIATTFTLPVIFKLNYKPSKTIYYCLESISHYGDQEMNKIIDSKVDFIIFPEENRAEKHIEITNTKLPFCIVYNCTNFGSDAIPVNKRNNRILYSGGIHKNTAYDYFLSDKIQDYPIDMYGLIEDSSVTLKNLIETQFRSLTKNVRYNEYIPYDQLENIRKSYSFSIVIWLPVDENTVFACPNKFFESIASGIPPIVAPIPQCVLLCKRYDCGIIMEDFSLNAFSRAIKQSLEMSPDRYNELVENCKTAVSNELNWNKQMENVIKLLK